MGQLSQDTVFHLEHDPLLDYFQSHGDIDEPFFFISFLLSKIQFDLGTPTPSVLLEKAIIAYTFNDDFNCIEV